MVLKKLIKAVVRPGGPAGKLNKGQGIIAGGVKKLVKKGLHHAAKSGALIHSGSSVSKGNMLRGIAQMKGVMPAMSMSKVMGGKMSMVKR